MACPAPTGSRYGNRISANRWSRVLRDLGHAVSVVDSSTAADEWRGDVLIALHAGRSSAAVRDFRKKFPHRFIIVVLTGTDLYREIRCNRTAQRSLQWADRLVVLQDKGPQELDRRLRERTRVIYQSALPTPVARPVRPRYFRVMVVGHLRHEKDPFRAAMAVRSLPPASRIRVEHFGAARQPSMADDARREMARNVRYRWYGDRPRWYVRRRLAQSQLFVISSRLEGGAGVVSEALADGVPILASRIPGNVGMLGQDYAGYYPRGDTRVLRDMLLRAESDARFLKALARQCRRRATLVTPEREIRAWRELLQEMTGSPGFNRP